MTTYANIDEPNRRVKIGSTRYRRSVQKAASNTEAKRLMLSHAFDDLACIAVEFRTHFFNHASRRAIERLGANVYSIIASEWPTVRVHLDFTLAAPPPC